jgi:hypothetical protein
LRVRLTQYFKGNHQYGFGGMRTIIDSFLSPRGRRESNYPII